MPLKIKLMSCLTPLCIVSMASYCSWYKHISAEHSFLKLLCIQPTSYCFPPSILCPCFRLLCLCRHGASTHAFLPNGIVSSLLSFLQVSAEALFPKGGFLGSPDEIKYLDSVAIMSHLLVYSYP